jgi:hypothetical protein
MSEMIAISKSRNLFIAHSSDEGKFADLGRAETASNRSMIGHASSVVKVPGSNPDFRCELLFAPHVSRTTEVTLMQLPLIFYSDALALSVSFVCPDLH